MKNEKLTLDITDMTPEGDGIGKIDGRVYFVPRACTGDRAEILVLKDLKSKSYAKLLSLEKPSPNRIDPECLYFEKCGGCAFQNINYDYEASLKRSFVENAFRRIGHLDCKISETVKGNPDFYRNKVQYPFACDENGKCVFGYYSRRSHRIIKHDFCMLQDRVFTDIASFCAEKCDFLNIKAYDEAKNTGSLRHAVMRKNRRNEIMLCLVVTDAENKLYNELAKDIQKNFDCVKSVFLNENKRKDNVIFGDKTVCISGEKYLTDVLCGKNYRLSPRSFYQVNADMAEKLYNIAKEKAALKDNEILLDLYCGVGTVGISIAEDSNRLCGVEIIEDAVSDAKQNARLNGRTDENTLFVCGDASSGVEKCREKFGSPDVIVVDPPRKGLSGEVIDMICRADPKRVVYISCNPSTLARDCADFAEKGFSAGEITPVDMFPRTGHIECVAALENKNI